MGYYDSKSDWDTNIYCEDCRHYYWDITFMLHNGILHTCQIESETKWKQSDYPSVRKPYLLHRGDCTKLNKNNDCKHFECNKIRKKRTVKRRKK